MPGRNALAPRIGPISSTLALRCPSCGGGDLESRGPAHRCRHCESRFLVCRPGESAAWCEEEICGRKVQYRCVLCAAVLCDQHARLKVLSEEFFRDTLNLFVYSVGAGTSRTLTLPSDSLLPDALVRSAYESHRELLARGTALGQKAYSAVNAAFLEFVSALQERTPSPVEAFEPGWLAAALHPTCSACLEIDSAIDRLFATRLGDLENEARQIDAELTRLEELGRQAYEIATRRHDLPEPRSFLGVRLPYSAAAVRRRDEIARAARTIAGNLSSRIAGITACARRDARVRHEVAYGR